MEKTVRELIEIAKSIVSQYKSEDLSNVEYIDNDNVVYYKAMAWGKDGERDLGFYIEFYKHSGQINPVICNTRNYNLYQVINFDSVRQALIEQLKFTTENYNNEN